MKRRDPPFTAFKRAESSARTLEDWMRKGYTREQAEIAMRHSARETIWMNSIYQVAVIELERGEIGDDFPLLIWLSIKRIDRKPIHDWRHLQRIKNELVGSENEAMELYPAESRIVDTANQYHLFVLRDPTLRFPFGFLDRKVEGSEAAARVGAKQRALEKETA